MAKDSGKIRRYGGRWVEEGKQFQERRRGLRAVLSRFWYVLVPILGIMCANQSYVRPDLEDIKNIKNLELKATLDEVDDLRTRMAGVETEVNTIEAEIDTLHAPRADLYTAIVDSLKQERLVYDRSLPETKGKIDSLQAVHDGISDEVEALAQSFRLQSARLDSLQGWQVTLVDSLAGLDGLIALRTDELYRVRHPKEYKRRDALFTGKGEYPRRDEKPLREKGE